MRRCCALNCRCFRDWLCGTHLQLKFSEADEQSWQACCRCLVDNALHQPQVFVHRDYHSRNLMVLQKATRAFWIFRMRWKAHLPTISLAC